MGYIFPIFGLEIDIEPKILKQYRKELSLHCLRDLACLTVTRNRRLSDAQRAVNSGRQRCNEMEMDRNNIQTGNSSQMSK